MKQLLQELDSGKTILVDTPSPSASRGHLLIETQVSLISVGTEKMLVNFARANYLQKAKQQPERVKMVFDKMKTEGIATTIDAVRSKLGQPLPLGYSNVGIVKEVGAGVSGFKVGDRVVSNGPHAEIVHVPVNLCAKIPDEVSSESASFVVLASIGLQSIRLAKPTLGETFVVSGVGLIGLLTVQALVANGCRVLALDFDQNKLELAKRFGAETCNLGQVQNPVDYGLSYTNGRGVDGVIITASTTSSDPISQAARMSRKRGRIIMVGVTGMELNRAEFYEKELSFQVSCSYGPGRYDVEYEKKGQDYPLGFVRWTEKRNFEAILDLMSSGRMKTEALIDQRFKFQNAADAFDYILENPHSLGVILDYRNSAPVADRKIQISSPTFKTALPIIGMIGAGNYSSRVLIPALKRYGAQLHSLISLNGLSSSVSGKKFGFKFSSTDTEGLLKDNEVNTVFITTQHNTHAKLVCDALDNGKNVFVEKPLAITPEEVQTIKDKYSELAKSGSAPALMVGFNRRFSPLTVKMKELLRGESYPLAINITVNSGFIPGDHWTQDMSVGGGRIIGETCHFIDLARFFTGSEIVDSSLIALKGSPDTTTISLKFKCGSIASIQYFANGASSFPKERVEVFCGGKILQLDNFLKLKGFGWKNFKSMKLWKQDKGQTECCRQFLDSLANGSPVPITPSEIFEVAKISVELSEMAIAL